MPSVLTRIIGVGNPLMGDDGIGIRAIELLQNEALPQSVELIDGGCGGLNLLPLFTDCRQLIIIDAADFGADAGRIRVLKNCDLHRIPILPPRQSGHQFGLAEILRLAQKLTSMPPLNLYLMQIKSCQPNSGLSSQVTAVLPDLIQKVTSSTINNHTLNSPLFTTNYRI